MTLQDRLGLLELHSNSKTLFLIEDVVPNFAQLPDEAVLQYRASTVGLAQETRMFCAGLYREAVFETPSSR